MPSFAHALRGKVPALVMVVTLILGASGVAQASGHAQTESNPEANLPYLLGVYTVTWLAFFAYAFYISRRQRELRRQIEELRRQLEEKKE